MGTRWRALFEPAELDERTIRVLLDALLELNIAYLADHPTTPRLYNSGVRYRRDASESWSTIPVVLRRGHGDCEDLASWRCGELRHAGIAARTIATRKSRARGGWLYHIRVQHPDGTIEDPSAQLGM